jgi:hypothetical protein
VPQFPASRAWLFRLPQARLRSMTETISSHCVRAALPNPNILSQSGEELIRILMLRSHTLGFVRLSFPSDPLRSSLRRMRSFCSVPSEARILQTLSEESINPIDRNNIEGDCSTISFVLSPGPRPCSAASTRSLDLLTACVHRYRYL